FIGPVVSDDRLNDFARGLHDREGNNFRDYNDAMRYMNERNHRSNLNNWQSGDLGAVRVCTDLTSAIANTYLIAATAVTPNAAGAKCLGLLMRGGTALGLAGRQAT